MHNTHHPTMLRRLASCWLIALTVLAAGASTAEAARWRRGRRCHSNCQPACQSVCQSICYQSSCCQSLVSVPPTSAAAPAWRDLLDGKTLAGWKPVEFGGEGEVYVEEGELRFGFGVSLTGVTYEKSVPKTNYEIRLQAKRVDGIDFFCGLTFPVAESHCSFIVGGWAGSVVGLSSIDGRDASENATTSYMSFKDKQWYDIRVRVTETHIQAWIDEQQVVNQDIRGKRITTRNEVTLNEPLGICAWQTKAALRNIQLRLLTPAEANAPIKATAKESAKASQTNK